MGDYYLKGIGVPSGIPQPEKAAACYASAANTQVSSLAMHNLGWMHENGIGVSQVSSDLAAHAFIRGHLSDCGCISRTFT
jgi:TPR repeat protein